ncbi:MAG: 4a-hydroxytetrahydrobiopterin dehydratase [Chloroflexi bacterium]|nr:4a-hydroxytetrahydrobiopterin dehydratase [Chloroflexota bacterium]
MASEALNEQQITERVSRLSGWAREGGTISKTFKLDTYMAGLAFASAIGTVCEARDHHPDMMIGWRKVTVSFTTHDVGSQLTNKDFDAAEAIDALGYPKAG